MLPPDGKGSLRIGFGLLPLHPWTAGLRPPSMPSELDVNDYSAPRILLRTIGCKVPALPLFVPGRAGFFTFSPARLSA